MNWNVWMPSIRGFWRAKGKNRRKKHTAKAGEHNTITHRWIEPFSHIYHSVWATSKGTSWAASFIASNSARMITLSPRVEPKIEFHRIHLNEEKNERRQIIKISWFPAAFQVRKHARRYFHSFGEGAFFIDASVSEAVTCTIYLYICTSIKLVLLSSASRYFFSTECRIRSERKCFHSRISASFGTDLRTDILISRNDCKENLKLPTQKYSQVSHLKRIRRAMLHALRDSRKSLM